MWGNPKGVTEADIARRIAKGFGQGIGIDYVPWIQKHDFSSEGVAKELIGILIPRQYHLLSKLEYKVYLPIERMKDVVDNRAPRTVFSCRYIFPHDCRFSSCPLRPQLG